MPTIISYTPGRCCCGEYRDLEEDFIHNEVVHQILRPPGNFCGAKHTHMVVRFEKEIEKLKNKIEELESDPDGRDQIYKQNLKLRTFLIKLEEEVRYVPDNVALWFATLSSRIVGVL